MEHGDVDKERTDSNKDEAGMLMKEGNSPPSSFLHTPGITGTVLPKDKRMCVANKHLHKFRIAVRVVQVIRSLIKIYREHAASRAQLMSLFEYAGATRQTSNLLFDRAYFKAKQERMISSEAQLVLSSPPENRTSEGIKLAISSLRAIIDSYAEYPMHIQEKLARAGWYECFGPGRVIIRQGHVPQNFFLILSGIAVVTKVSVNKKTGELYSKTVAFLKRGKCFGVLSRSSEASSFFGAIFSGDFLNIFVNSKSHEGPEYMKLLHSIEVLSGWPVEKLPYNNPRICAHTCFRPGTIITKDSKASSKIYVIKTGTVRVLKAMTPPKPQIAFKSFQLSKRCKECLDSKESLTGCLSKSREHGSTKKNFSSSFQDEENLLPVLEHDKRPLKQEPTASMHHDGSAAANSSATKTKITERGENFQLYIHIQTLRVGDVFGLAYAVYEDTFSMALVSDGAECILISKEFFRKHMDENYLYKLSTTLQPYPSKEVLKAKMQDYINWKAYRALLIKRTS
uniref:Cyclic nucleotide-binding domain-containing protein 2-like n=1 Tax=Geotrypetes seraphini TaxID=260995 RepID=A0A6P8R8E3_GEOSA|nr:cyclic nucleotide-binding domain-containing protein 2-like [Geotrypetes seraphini]